MLPIAWGSISRGSESNHKSEKSTQGRLPNVDPTNDKFCWGASWTNDLEIWPGILVCWRTWASKKVWQKLLRSCCKVATSRLGIWTSWKTHSCSRPIWKIWNFWDHYQARWNTQDLDCYRLDLRVTRAKPQIVAQQCGKVFQQWRLLRIRTKIGVRL